ncbi:MAG: ATP-binding protein [Cellulomonas sp.]
MIRALLRDRAPGASMPWTEHTLWPVLGMALLATALLVGLASFAALENTQAVENSAQRSLRSNRDAAVRAVEHQGRALTEAVAAMATHEHVIDSLREPGPDTRDAVDDQLSTLARTVGAYSSFVTDATGLIVDFYPIQRAIIGQSFSFRDWFKGVSQTRLPYVSVAYRTAATGHPCVVAVSAPVLDGSRALGSLTVLWSLESIRAVVDGARTDDGVALVVTDQHGVPLLGAVAADERGEPLPVELSAATTRALAGSTTSEIANGTFAETAPVPGLGWTVTATLPVAVGLAPTSAFTRQLVAALCGAILFVLIVATLAGRLIRARVTERASLVRAQAALRITERRFQRVFDESLTGQVLINRTGDITRVNAALTHLVDRSARGLVGSPFVSIFAAELDKVAIGDVITSGRGELRGSMALLRSGGRGGWGLVALSWLDERDGDRVLLAQIDDVTATVTANLEREQELRSKNQFLSHVSHELRSPLAVVHQFSSLLIDGVGGPLTDDQEEFLDVVARNVKQLKVMIDDLLEVSRVGSGRLTFDCEPLALGAVLTQTLAGYTRTAGDREIALQLEYGDLPLVVANAERVHEVVANLIDNALKFTPSGGLIAVEAVRQGDSVQVSVRDTGRGIKVENLEHIFEQSFQGDHNSEESRKGLGLGLYICRALIESQGGQIWASSPPTCGTTVTFTLPCPVRRRADQMVHR